MAEDRKANDSNLQEFFDVERAAEIATRWPLLASAWSTLAGQPLPDQTASGLKTAAASERATVVPHAAAPRQEPARVEQAVTTAPVEPDLAYAPTKTDTSAEQSLDALFRRLRQT